MSEDQYAATDTTIVDRKAVLEPGAARTIGFLLGALAIFWGIVKFLTFRIGEEDRPPIRVRNPDIDFTTGRGWVTEDPFWKPDHRKGRRTDHFVVDIRSPSGHSPMKASGVEFHCDLAHGKRKIKLSAMPHNARKEPRLHPSSALKLDSTSKGKRLFVQEGSRLEKIVIQGSKDVEVDLTGSTGAIDIYIYPKRDY